jgi:hypothetical protein
MKAISIVHQFLPKTHGTISYYYSVLKIQWTTSSCSSPQSSYFSVFKDINLCADCHTFYFSCENLIAYFKWRRRYVSRGSLRFARASASQEKIPPMDSSRLLSFSLSLATTPRTNRLAPLLAASTGFSPCLFPYGCNPSLSWINLYRFHCHA